ncbi:hypothetical protein BDV33DRAFT_165359 [Aspergillus novoparasiticus]|uniref:NmrA-like domain-containing protein n=1 Tax=Aspergillus novoparasiticus TaxID=986946 RepID=A0A5N6F4H5_9EURO|nr:hypothetical protein BDV33DRAFT_165359 [Aspergillus novoparasiticus]
MSKTLAVFGATGQQGGSVIDYVLNDPELSQQYRIRAITRNAESAKAQQLKENVEVIQGDVLNQSSLRVALTGAHTIFAMTTPTPGPDALEIEYQSAKAIADVAVEQGAEYIIFSTLPAISEISGGKYTQVTPFEAKAQGEKYIRGLPIKSAFFSPGSFMENYQLLPFLRPREAPDGTWVMVHPMSPKGLLPLIDAVGDTGKFIGAILAEPDKYEGKTFCAATALYSLDEIAAVMSKATGKTIVCKQVPPEEFQQSLPFLALAFNVFIEGFQSIGEFGYYGPDSDRLVAWAVENARGRLSTFEEYLEAHPLRLE